MARSGAGSRVAWRIAATAAAALTLAACAGMPRSGPAPGELTTADEATETLEGLVAPLDPAALALLPPPPPQGFPAAFAAADPIDPERIRPHDRLDVVIWESEEDGVFGPAGGASRLDGVTVDGRGRIYVPFVGELPAAGETPARLRDRLRAALGALILSPQVDVRLAAAAGREVTVQGAVGRPGVYPIDATALRLTPLLAEAGGVALPPEQAEVVVQRDGARGAALLRAVFDDPGQDVALRPGDRVIVEALRERFVVLGATTTQAELPFATRPFTLLSAMGTARGLRDFDADPTGVFVFRREDAAVADALLPGPPPEGLPPGPGRPIVYRLDLTEPGALFLARQFVMRDGDAIFVTNAPLAELRKFIQLFTSVLTPVQQTSTVSGL